MTRTVEFKKFDLMSVAKLSIVFYLIIGLIYGVLFHAYILIVFSGGAGMMGTALFIATLPTIVVITFAGFVITVLATFIYNLIAARIGGIKVEVE